MNSAQKIIMNNQEGGLFAFENKTTLNYHRVFLNNYIY